MLSKILKYITLFYADLVYRSVCLEERYFIRRTRAFWIQALRLIAAPIPRRPFGGSVATLIYGTCLKLSKISVPLIAVCELPPM
jgi:hypothetical protein